MAPTDNDKLAKRPKNREIVTVNHRLELHHGKSPRSPSTVDQSGCQRVLPVLADNHSSLTPGSARLTSTSKAHRSHSGISDAPTSQQKKCSVPKENSDEPIQEISLHQKDGSDEPPYNSVDEDNEFSTDSEEDYFYGAKEVENGKPEKKRTTADSLKTLAKEAASMYHAAKQMANSNVQQRVRRDYLLLRHPKPDRENAELNANLEASWTPPNPKGRRQLTATVAERDEGKHIGFSD